MSEQIPIPCPFCGSQEPTVTTWECNDGFGDGWRCGCLEPECDMNPFTKTRWATEAEAIKSWNRRKLYQP